MDRQEIIHTALNYISVDRAATHGDAEDSFAEIAKLWSWYNDNRTIPEGPFEARDVAMMMSLFKIARICNNTKHEDSYIDLVGYAALAGEISTQEET